MADSRLVNRNVTVAQGRTSIRLEPELWDALHEICRREAISIAELMQMIEGKRTSPAQAGEEAAGGRTSSVRVYILDYFRAAATESGHSHAGHGTFPARCAAD